MASYIFVKSKSYANALSSDYRNRVYVFVNEEKALFCFIIDHHSWLLLCLHIASSRRLRHVSAKGIQKLSYSWLNKVQTFDTRKNMRPL